MQSACRDLDYITHWGIRTCRGHVAKFQTGHSSFQQLTAGKSPFRPMLLRYRTAASANRPPGAVSNRRWDDPKRKRPKGRCGDAHLGAIPELCCWIDTAALGKAIGVDAPCGKRTFDE